MPVAVSGEKVTATFDDGVLAVTLPVPIANCAMEVEGDDLDDPFAIAAAAVAELMVDGHRPLTVERPVPFSAPAPRLGRASPRRLGIVSKDSGIRTSMGEAMNAWRA